MLAVRSNFQKFKHMFLFNILRLSTMAETSVLVKTQITVGNMMNTAKNLPDAIEFNSEQCSDTEYPSPSIGKQLGDIVRMKCNAYYKRIECDDHVPITIAAPAEPLDFKEQKEHPNNVNSAAKVKCHQNEFMMKKRKAAHLITLMTKNVV